MFSLLPNIPSLFYNYSNKTSLDDVNRTDRVAIVIEILVDCIFLAMYVSRIDGFSKYKNAQSTKHIVTSINHCRFVIIRTILAGVHLNPIEDQLIVKLNTVLSEILMKTTVERRIESMDKIEACLDQTSFDTELVSSIKNEIRFVLAVANQLDYMSEVIVIPYIRIFNPNEGYNKDIVSITGIRFDLLRSMISDNQCNSLWYRIYKGLKFISSDSKDKIKLLQHICLAINIGITPDFKSGLGLTNFPFESFFVSDSLKKFANESNSYFNEKVVSIFDKTTVIKNLSLNNTDLIEQASMEADFTDQVGASDDVGNEEDQQDDTAEVEGNEEAQDEGASTTDGTDFSSTDDTQVDDTGENESEDTLSTDSSNNQEQTETKLLGFNVKLSVNETLDSFMYKVYVAKFVDNLIKFNHDDVPTETLMILRKWKSSLLFLTDAEETKRLLRSLKVNLK